MALGFGKSKTSDSSSSSPPNEKAEPKFDNTNSYNAFSADQTTAEHGGFRKANKPMNRIDRPITTSITGDSAMGDSSTDVSVSIGKQMELEADNAIKYRTCSWQKVFIILFYFYSSPFPVHLLPFSSPRAFLMGKHANFWGKTQYLLNARLRSVLRIFMLPKAVY